MIMGRLRGGELSDLSLSFLHRELAPPVPTCPRGGEASGFHPKLGHLVSGKLT